MCARHHRHQNSRHKRCYWLPVGVSAYYNRMVTQRIQLHFFTRWSDGSGTQVFDIAAGLVDEITEFQALAAQNAIIHFRQLYEACELEGRTMSKDGWTRGRWREQPFKDSGIRPPRPYTSVTSVAELIGSKDKR